MNIRSLTLGREGVKAWIGRQWREWRLYVLFFCFVWVPLRSAVFDYNPVPTGSMNPTILEGDVVWVNKLAYGLRVPLTQHYVARWADPQRGDIVVVLSPKDGTRLVKRVVGVPGDTVALQENRLVLNGLAVNYEPATDNYADTIARRLSSHAFFAEEHLAGVQHAVMGLRGAPSSARTFPAVTVPPGGYFLMGDSRDNSRDSREIGFASRDAILGKATGVFVSLDINDTYLPRVDRFFSALR